LSIAAYMIQEDVKAWVAYQKKKWAIQLEARRQLKKRRKLEESGGGDSLTTFTKPSLSSRSLTGFMQHTAHSILNTPWQILQVRIICYGGVYLTIYNENLLFNLFDFEKDACGCKQVYFDLMWYLYRY